MRGEPAVKVVGRVVLKENCDQLLLHSLGGMLKIGADKLANILHHLFSFWSDILYILATNPLIPPSTTGKKYNLVSWSEKVA